MSSEDKRNIFLKLPIGTKLTVISQPTRIIDLSVGEVVTLKSMVYIKHYAGSVDPGDKDLPTVCVIEDRHGFMSEHFFGNFTCDAWEIFKKMNHASQG